MNEFAKRVLGPFSLPLAAAAFLGVLVLAFSRILLAVEEMASTSLALLIAAEVLGVCTVLAAATKVRSSQKALIFLSGLGIVAGGAVSANIGIREIGGHAEAVTIAAKDLKFDTETLHVPADAAFTLSFANNDPSIPHNVAIYKDESFTTGIFTHEPFNGVATKAFEVEPIPAGTYFFRCDVHPDMKGEVEAAAGEHGGEGGGAADETIAAKDIAFDKATLELPATGEISLLFDNQDAGVPHNVAIYKDAAFAELVFDGRDITGPAKETYTFASPGAGTFFFRCDIHPSMKGEVTFA